jgi:hypothetical protein
MSFVTRNGVRIGNWFIHNSQVVATISGNNLTVTTTLRDYEQW